MKKFTNEMKTGTVIVLAILVGIFFWLKTSNFISATYKLKTHFNRAEGVKENSIVNLAGIEVGRVESVRFLYEPDQTMVELVLLIHTRAKVREDSIAFIGTTGFIGDAYIGITPGTSKTFLKQNEVIISEDPIDARLLMKRADKISENLDSILGDVKTIVTDNKGKIEGIIVNLEETTENFNEFSDDIRMHPWKLIWKSKPKKEKKK